MKHLEKLKTPAFARRKCKKLLWLFLGMIHHEAQTYFLFQNFTAFWSSYDAK